MPALYRITELFAKSKLPPVIAICNCELWITKIERIYYKVFYSCSVFTMSLSGDKKHSLTYWKLHTYKVLIRASSFYG